MMNHTKKRETCYRRHEWKNGRRWVWILEVKGEGKMERMREKENEKEDDMKLRGRERVLRQGLG